MEAVWKNNLEVLKNTYVGLADTLEKARKTSSFQNMEGDAITSGIAEVADKKVLYTTKGTKEYQLDTLYDSNILVDMWYDALPKLDFMAKVFLFGLGNGMYVRKLLEKANNSITIVIYEPSVAVLVTVLENWDMTDILTNDRVVMLVKDNLTAPLFDYFSELLDFRDIEGLIYLSYLNYNRLFKTEYDEYFDVLQYTVDSIGATQKVLGKMGDKYNENFLENVSYFIEGKSLEELYKRLPRNHPAFIIAAGPSLDNNIEELKHINGRGLIIAVDTALRPLLRHGIKPDLCISVDGNKMATHFSEAGAHEIPLVCSISSKGELLQAHKAPIFFTNDLNRYVQYFLSKVNKVLPALSTGGSVANDAFSLARVLGFTTIVLVGQDLAYTGNRTHSADSVRGEWKMDISTLGEEQSMVEGIDGEPVLASLEFNLYRRWFEEQIEKTPELHVIDATQGGALIHGTTIQTLRETIEKECHEKTDYFKIIADTPEFFTLIEAKQFKDYLKKMPEDYRRCLKRAQDGIRDYDKMIELTIKQKAGTSEMKRLLTRTGENAEILQKEPVMEFAENSMQQYTSQTLRNIYCAEEDEKQEIIMVCQKGKETLQHYEQTIKSLLEKAIIWCEHEFITNK